MAARNRDTGVTAKQDAFAFETVRLGDANKAYRVAYDASGMSQASVRAEVSKMMRHQSVVDRIEHYRRIADAHLDVSIGRIAKELARVGFADPAELYDEHGRMYPLHMMPEDARRSVQSVTIVERKTLMPVLAVRDKAGNLIDEIVPGADANAKKRAAKALKRQEEKGDVEIGFDFVGMREKKVTLHDKLPALQLMAKWKKMVDDRGGETEDPNDVRRMSDEDLEQRIAADEAFLKGIRAARGKSKAGQAAERAKAVQTQKE